MLYDLDKMIELAYQQARTIMCHMDRPLVPAFLLVNADDTVEVLGCEMGDDRQRAQLASQLKARMRSSHTIAYSFVTEAWTAIRTAEELTEGPIRAEDQVDRREIVVALATDGKESRCPSWEIIRDWKGRCIDLALPPFEATERPDSFTGWITQLLEKT